MYSQRTHICSILLVIRAIGGSRLRTIELIPFAPNLHSGDNVVRHMEHSTTGLPRDAASRALCNSPGVRFSRLRDFSVLGSKWCIFF